MTDINEAYKTTFTSSKYPLKIAVSPNEIMKQYYNVKNSNVSDRDEDVLFNHTFSKMNPPEYIPKEDDDLLIFSEWKPKTQHLLKLEKDNPKIRVPMKPAQHCVYRADATMVCPTTSSIINNKLIVPYQDCSDEIQTEIAKFFFSKYNNQYKGINDMLRLKYFFNNIFIGGNTLFVALDHDKLYGTIGIDTKHASRVHLSHLATFDSNHKRGFMTMLKVAEEYCKKFGLYQRMYLHANRNELHRNQELGFKYESEEQTKHGWKILMYRLISNTSCF